MHILQSNRKRIVTRLGPMRVFIFGLIAHVLRTGVLFFSQPMLVTPFILLICKGCLLSLQPIGCFLRVMPLVSEGVMVGRRITL